MRIFFLLDALIKIDYLSNEAAAIFYENSTTGIDKSIPKGRLKQDGLFSCCIGTKRKSPVVLHGR